MQFLGFSEALDKGSFGGFTVAELSGLTYDHQAGVYYAVADRAGPVRSHVFTLDLPVTSESLGVPSVRGVTVLNNPSGVPYDGSTLDAEGSAITAQKVLLIASEGGAAAGEQPEIRRFSLEGNELESLPVPPRFLVGTNNLSFESLALSPNGRSLFTSSERPLPAVGPNPADGQTADLRNRIRIVRYEDRGPGGFVPTAQYFYLTEPDRASGDVGVAEIVALSEDELLVLERGFVAGQGNTVRVFRVSVQGGHDVSNEPTLAAAGLVPLTKTVMFDVRACPDQGATIPPGAVQPNALLDNIEAMTLGPQLPGGRRALLLLSDDNAASVQKTRVIALAIGGSGPSSAGQSTDVRPTGIVREFGVTLKSPDLLVPNTFTVTVGDTIRFRVKNEGPAPHNLHIGGSGVDVESPLWPAGSAAVWEYTFTRPGVYAIYCTVGARGLPPGTQHRHVGPMEGVIVVTEPGQTADLARWQTRTIPLASLDNSGVTGTAYIQPRADGGLGVRVEAQGLKPGMSYLSGLYDRRSVNCSGGLMGNASAPMRAAGATAQILYTTSGSVNDLFSVAIREGTTAPGTAVACGDVSKAVLGVDAKVMAAAPTALPRTGDDHLLVWLLGIATLGGWVVVLGIMARRRATV